MTELDELIDMAQRFQDLKNEVTFGWALLYMRHGQMMHYAPWGDEVRFACVYDPSQWEQPRDKVTEPYFYQVTGDNRLRVWVPTTEELLSDQWRKV